MVTIRSSQRRFPVDSSALGEAVDQLLFALHYHDFDVGILFVSSKAMRTYNKQYRNKDKATDVLSFPFYPELKPRQRIKACTADEKNLGDIIICPEYVWQQFADMPDWDDTSKSAQRALLHARIIVLIIHGLCHLLGYDHETVAQYRSMHRKELSLLKVLRDT